MSERLTDHELTVCVEIAAKGVINARASHAATPTWDQLSAMEKNTVREQALPFIFHGTKALADLGYWKSPTITTAQELRNLYNSDRNVVIMDDHGLILQNLAGGWKSPGTDRYMTSDMAHDTLGPAFRVLLFGEELTLPHAKEEVR